MALVKCKECGEKVSTEAKSCPKCGAKPPKKTSIFTLAIVVFIFFFVSYSVWQTEYKLTPEQKEIRKEKRAIATKEKETAEANEVAKKLEKKKENRLKGFHCLSSWNGSHPAVKKYVEERMRDPDSFEHVETRITPVNVKGTHQLVMKYRAANGFGGLTLGNTTATIENTSCQATITSME